MLGQPINSLIKPPTIRRCRIGQVSSQAQALARADCPYQIYAINLLQMRRQPKQSIVSTCIAIFLTLGRCGNQTRRQLLDFQLISKSELMNDQFNSPIQSPCKHLHAANTANHMSPMTLTKLGRRPSDKYAFIGREMD